MTKAQLMAQMDVSMGGRVAEELVYGADKVTTGLWNSLLIPCWHFEGCLRNRVWALSIAGFPQTW